MKQLSDKEKSLCFGGASVWHKALLAIHGFVSFSTSVIDIANLAMDTRPKSSSKPHIAENSFPTLKNDNLESTNTIIS